MYGMAAGADGDCSDRSCWKPAGKGPGRGGAIAPTCGNWSTNAGGQNGWAGRPGFPVAWSAFGALPCNVAQRVMCIAN